MACGENKKTDNSDTATNASSLIEEISGMSQESQSPVRIDVSVSPKPGNVEDLVWYRAKEKDNIIEIEPTSDYYDAYTSSSVMDVDKFVGRDFLWSDFIINPSFEINIINEGEEKLGISELEIEVEESTIDTFPYIYIYEWIEGRYGLYLQNESWSDWGKMTLEYSFPHRGEKFDGKYKYKLEIPYFEQTMAVDFKNDIVKEGFDANLIEDYVYDFDDDSFVRKGPIVGNGASNLHLTRKMLPEDFDLRQLKKLAYPFEYTDDYYGMPMIFARVYGKLSFSKHPFTTKFTAVIPLTSSLYGGADNTLVDKFNVELKPEGKNYTLRYPYKTTIGTGDSERIGITVKCAKSSNHNFRIRLKNSEGETIGISRQIKFHNLNGRHSSYYLLKEQEYEY